MLTDGPYAETKEQLGGYYLLECKDLDEALTWAAQIPEAKTGAVEVRPVMDYEAMGLTRKPAGRISSIACSGASRGRRSRSSPASSATSTAPRRRCRTRSSPRWSAGRATGCRPTPRPGSSPRRATGRSTGSAPRGAGRGGMSRWRPSCGRCGGDEDAEEPELVSPIPDERLRLIFTPATRRWPRRRGWADAARARRADDGRGRARVPGRRAGDGAAARARQAQDRGAGIKYEVPRDADLPARLRASSPRSTWSSTPATGRPSARSCARRRSGSAACSSR